MKPSKPGIRHSKNTTFRPLGALLATVHLSLLQQDERHVRTKPEFVL